MPLAETKPISAALRRTPPERRDQRGVGPGGAANDWPNSWWVSGVSSGGDGCASAAILENIGDRKIGAGPSVRVL